MGWRFRAVLLFSMVSCSAAAEARVNRHAWKSKRSLVLVLWTGSDFLPIPQDLEAADANDGKHECPVWGKVVARDARGRTVPLLRTEVARLRGSRVTVLVDASTFGLQDPMVTPTQAGKYDFSLNKRKRDVLKQELLLEVIARGGRSELRMVEGDKDTNENGRRDLCAILYPWDSGAQARVTASVGAPRGVRVRVEYRRVTRFQAPPGLWIPVPVAGSVIRG